MRNYLFFSLLVATALSLSARDFSYAYKSQTITYTVIDEDAKTCMTKAGASAAGNIATGQLQLPSNPKDGDMEFTLVSIGDYAFYYCTGMTSVTEPNTVTSIGSL
ncbi:MAG: leucine-rich repeat domain-containing protein, partial [Muribaculaceae bacterium]|nr:leucine-rich repeat domain-containing protein [Muribaculaceae bacterium]